MRQIHSETNPSGFVESRIVPSKASDGSNQFTTLPEMDCFRYNDERLSTFNILMTMINNDLHHIMQTEINEKRPAQVWTAMNKYFNGHLHKHVQIAKEKLEAFRFNSITSADVATLRELVRQLEMSQGIPLNDSYKINLLRIIVNSHPNKETLNLSFQNIQNHMKFYQILNHILSIEDVAPASMKFCSVVGTGKKITCFANMQGLCKLGNNCSRPHIIIEPHEYAEYGYLPEKKMKPIDKNKSKNDKNKGKGHNNNNKKKS